jgi:uncharacterized membrane protein YesL
MFGFLIKKTFFDMWDNMFRILIMNIGFDLIIAYFLIVIQFLSPLLVLFLPAVFIGIALLFIFIGAVSKMTADIADSKQVGFADFWAGLKESYPSSLLIAVCVSGFILVVTIAFSFYGSLQSIAGPLAIGFLFWVTVVMVLAFQFVFPIQSRMDRKLRKIIKKSFLVLLDNPGFSFGMAAGSLVIFAFSLPFFFILPGLSTIQLFWNVGLKLRLYKYDYLEQNPTANRRKIPWDALLINDREKVGKRTLKGMIFPWKE